MKKYVDLHRLWDLEERSEVQVVVYSTLLIYRPWDLEKFQTLSPPRIGSKRSIEQNEMRVVVNSFLPIYRPWDLEERNKVQVDIYAQGLGKIPSSSSIERPWANKEDMKHDLYFLRVKSWIYASHEGGEPAWVDPKLFHCPQIRPLHSIL